MDDGDQDRSSYGTPRDRSWLFLIVVIAVPVLFVDSLLWNMHRRAADMLANGIAVQAKLVAISDRQCRTKGGCWAEADYRFTPRGSENPIDGTVDVPASHDEIEQYHYVRDTGTVPLLYDRRDPGRTMFFWKDRIERHASLGWAVKYCLLVAMGFLTVFSPLIIGCWRFMRRKTAANATAKN